MSLEQIANELKGLREVRGEDISLIYAFNATGKTRLSVAYKDATKNPENGQHAGVYYNAFSEDLFVWDNDEENDGANIRLKILPSSLNQFHSFIYEDTEAFAEKLNAYNPKYEFRLNGYENPEEGIESVSFFIAGEEESPIKISRGEERTFVWCFFLALLEVDGWSNVQNAHIFIDDPVSSLDEHNIFITADTLFQLIESHYNKKRIIITTHHIGLFSILSNRLTKGEKSGRFKNITGEYILKFKNNELVLELLKKNVFLYHLHLLQVLDKAKSDHLYTYHFALLRQLLETIASFLGSGRTGHALKEIGVENVEDVLTVINTHSHKNIYYYQTEMMNPTEQSYFNDVFEKIVNKFNFSY